MGDSFIIRVTVLQSLRWSMDAGHLIIGIQLIISPEGVKQDDNRIAKNIRKQSETNLDF